MPVKVNISRNPKHICMYCNLHDAAYVTGYGPLCSTCFDVWLTAGRPAPFRDQYSCDICGTNYDYLAYTAKGNLCTHCQKRLGMVKCTRCLKVTGHATAVGPRSLCDDCYQDHLTSQMTQFYQRKMSKVAKVAKNYGMGPGKIMPVASHNDVEPLLAKGVDFIGRWIAPRNPVPKNGIIIHVAWSELTESPYAEDWPHILEHLEKNGCWINMEIDSMRFKIVVPDGFGCAETQLRYRTGERHDED